MQNIYFQFKTKSATPILIGKLMNLLGSSSDLSNTWHISYDILIIPYGYKEIELMQSRIILYDRDIYLTIWLLRMIKIQNYLKQTLKKYSGLLNHSTDILQNELQYTLTNYSWDHMIFILNIKYFTICNLQITLYTTKHVKKIVIFMAYVM